MSAFFHQFAHIGSQTIESEIYREENNNMKRAIWKTIYRKEHIQQLKLKRLGILSPH